MDGQKVNSKAIQDYIDQQLTIKMDVLKSDVNDMLKNMQLDTIRQF